MKLNRAEAKAAIESFLENYKAAKAEIEKLQDLLNCVDAPIFEAMYKSMIGHIALIDSLTDDCETLHWFVFDGKGGSEWLTCRMPNGEGRDIKTVDDLLWMMGYGDE